MGNADALLASAQRLADEVLAPRAEAADHAFAPDPDTFRALSEAGFAGLTIKPEFGGLGASGDLARAVGEILGAACGCTYFTFHQHWSAIGLIDHGDNLELKQRVYPKLASGEWWTGVGFSHLRRPGPPNARAEEIHGGYLLSGFIPWFSGWPLYRHGVLAAKMPDEREVFLFTEVSAPARRTRVPPDIQGSTRPSSDGTPDLREEQSGGILASEPMALCAMQGSGTVQLTLNGLFVPRANTCFVGEPNWLRTRDATNITLHAHNPIIVAAASVKLLREIARKKANPVIDEAAEALARELESLRKRVSFWSQEENKTRPDYTPEAMTARTESIHLAIRAAHACCVASAGAANALSHPAQRYYREAMFYSVQGQTQDVMEATLRLLTLRVN